MFWSIWMHMAQNMTKWNCGFKMFTGTYTSAWCFSNKVLLTCTHTHDVMLTAFMLTCPCTWCYAAVGVGLGGMSTFMSYIMYIIYMILYIYIYIYDIQYNLRLLRTLCQMSIHCDLHTRLMSYWSTLMLACTRAWCNTFKWKARGRKRSAKKQTQKRGTTQEFWKAHFINPWCFLLIFCHFHP